MKFRFLLILVAIISVPVIIWAQGNFSTSLHSTREGKATAYNKENGGMELLTGIELDQLPCKSCHAENYPDGTPVDNNAYKHSCRDCHNTADNNSVSEGTCLSCHSRKIAETNMYPNHENPHTEHGMKCWSCHQPSELHGDDGVQYASMLAEGAIKAKCTNCHSVNNLPSNTAHSIHGKSDKFECQACHVKAVVQCQNCHIESVIEGHIKRANTQTKDFQMLVKRRGKYTSGSFMTHVYDGKTNVIIAPLTGHLIDKDGKSCGDCHFNKGGTNKAIKSYNETGEIKMLSYNEASHKLENMTGVIPLPLDWDKTLKFDFADYEGDPTTSTDQTQWTFLTNRIDNAHLFYAEPLTADEMTKLGFTREPNSVPEYQNSVFSLYQNYPNPVTNNTQIKFRLNKRAQVSLNIYDMEGKLIKSLINNEMNPNEYAPSIDMSGLPQGTYIYKLQADEYSKTLKMVVKR